MEESRLEQETPDLEYANHEEHVRGLLTAAMAAADPARALRSNWPLALHDLDNCYVVGGGKATLEMALQLNDLCKLSGGALAVVPERLARARKLNQLPATFETFPVTHPFPEERNMVASREIARIAREAGEGDTVIVLLSGGGSAMLTLPANGLVLDNLRDITVALQSAGAPITALNTVRKHCEQLKGGLLARLAYPARVWAFILSDVVGDRLNVIASGPTAADPTTYEDALSVLEYYNLVDAVPAVTAHIRKGVAGDIPETVKPGDETLTHVTNMLIGSNRGALEAARKYANNAGIQVVGFEFGVEGEARIVGMQMALRAKDIMNRHDRPACYLMGGETTVTVHGDGRGGRNQELVLSAAIQIDGMENVAVAAFATDGVDGQSEAAGAFATGETCAKARAMGLSPEDYLNRNDSFTFFKKVGGLIDLGGPSGTNVNDVAIAIVY